MSSILKVDTIQDQSGNNIINENADTITIGASGDTINIVGTLQNNGSAVGGGTQAFDAGTAGDPSITTTGDTNTGIFFPAADTIAFTEGGTEAMRINSDGAMLLGTTTAGSASAGDLVVNGGVFLGGSAAANELNDYEEGTWTPVLTDETTAVYTAQTGFYKKIGNTVFIYFSIALSSKGDISGAYTRVGALPFNGVAGGSRFGSGQISTYRTSSTANIQGIEFGGGTPGVGWFTTGGGSVSGYLNTSFVADNSFFEGFGMYKTD